MLALRGFLLFIQIWCGGDALVEGHWGGEGLKMYCTDGVMGICIGSEGEWLCGIAPAFLI